jgi:hypothetical protein
LIGRFRNSWANSLKSVNNFWPCCELVNKFRNTISLKMTRSVQLLRMNRETVYSLLSHKLHVPNMYGRVNNKNKRGYTGQQKLLVAAQDTIMYTCKRWFKGIVQRILSRVGTMLK